MKLDVVSTPGRLDMMSTGIDLPGCFGFHRLTMCVISGCATAQRVGEMTSYESQVT